MFRANSLAAILVVCGPLLLCAAPRLARAADETPINNLRRGYSDEKLARHLGEAVINAAHPSGGDVTYKRHSWSDDDKRPDRKTLTIQMTFTGALSGKKYVAEVEIRFDTARDSWEVLDIDCTDNAPFAANRRNMDSLKKRLNDD